MEFATRFRRSAVPGIISTCLAVTTAALAQNPNSAPTSTGQILTARIVSPADNTVFFDGPACEVPVQGLATLSSLPTTSINVLYVIDLSGSTGDPTNVPPVDVNGDGVVDDKDDLNKDGFQGDVLDAEIGGAIALNNSIHDLEAVRVGVVVYASNAALVDISPEDGRQSFTSSPRADRNDNGTPDIEEVLTALDSDPRFGGSAGKFTEVGQDVLGNSTNFEDALRTVLAAFDTGTESSLNLVFFLSDGFSTSGGPIDDELSAARTRGIVINALGITAASDPSALSAMADSTGGTFVQVVDPSRLAAEITTIRPLGLAGVTLNGSAVELSPVGSFSDTLRLVSGETRIAATAIAEDSTTVTASISVVCADTAFSCRVEILSPLDNTTVCGDSVDVLAVTTTSGGTPPFDRRGTINGIPVASEGDTLRARIHLPSGTEQIVAEFTFTDFAGNQAVCRDSVRVRRAVPPSCRVDIVAPRDGTTLCGDSVEVRAATIISGGSPPVSVVCQINGLLAVQKDSLFVATVPVDSARSLLVVTCTVTDSCGSETVCRDSVVVLRPAPPTCAVRILSPADGTVFCGTDSLTVTASTSVAGAQPLSISCEVNGIPAVKRDSVFVATIPFAEQIVALCTVTDSCGQSVVCQDSIRVARPRPLACNVQILTPPDSLVTCAAESLTVVASVQTPGGLAAEITCEINGFPASKQDSLFQATIPFAAEVVATCTAVDSCGTRTVCADTTRLLLDETPPRCSFHPDGAALVGTFSDQETGIFDIVPRKLINATLSVDPAFQPGDTVVAFRIDPIRKHRFVGFNIDVFDACGNQFTCDPVFLQLAADDSPRQAVLTFPATDRYFELTNAGLNEIRAELNGHNFTLTADPSRAAPESNLFAMPAQGKLTIDLQGYLLPEENRLKLSYAGLPGAAARVLLQDVTDGVDFVLQLQSLPKQFALAQNYPNPFNPTTTIRFDIPDRMADGVQTTLRIYNLLGALVRELVDERLLPGRHSVIWNGLDRHGRPVSSGIYLYRLVAGDFKQTRRMLLLK